MREVQAPVQAKKNKKKTKTDVKPVQQVSTIDGKEPDDGEIRLWWGKFLVTSHFSDWLFISTPLILSVVAAYLTSVFD